MYEGKLVFSQVMDHAPQHLFRKYMRQYGGNRYVKSFFGTPENAVKTQIWTAAAVYVLVAIVRKRLGLSASLYTIIQALSLTLVEKTPISQLLAEADYPTDETQNPKQMN